MYQRVVVFPSIVQATAAITIVALLAVAMGCAASQDESSSAASADATVTVFTDASRYAPAEPITAHVVNATVSPIAPFGGIVCQGSPWPFTIERLSDDGTWHPVAYPRTLPCVGIDAAPLAANKSFERTFMVPLEPGTYRAVYAYSVSDDGGAVADSQPFQVVN